MKTGGLGDMSAALPAQLAALGHEVHILMPLYGCLQLPEKPGKPVTLQPYGQWPAARLLPLKLRPRLNLLLLDCPDLYARAGGPYLDAQGRDFPDNLVRFGMLSRVAALVGSVHSPVGGKPFDVVHANDWPTALAPMYLALHREAGEPTAASVLTIHNLSFRGEFPLEDATHRLGVPHRWRGPEGVEFWGQLSTLKAGLQFADAITTVSPTYAREIQEPEAGFGFEGLMRAHAQRLHGITNGIDTEIWNPATDPRLRRHFNVANLRGKAFCKTAVQQQFGLAQDKSAMLLGMVSRLTSQKGVDLVLQALPRILELSCQVVVVGQGDRYFEQAFREASRHYPSQLAAMIGFDEAAAHLVEAGADAFLMPSRFEPCGLNQMYSQAYGTPPIVAPVGGLLDTVADVGEAPDAGTGFLMRRCDAGSLENGVARAHALWKNPKKWRRIQVNGMQKDFGWESSAQRYLRVYTQSAKRAPLSAAAAQPRPAAPAFEMA